MAGLLFSASGLPLPNIPQQFGSLLAGAAAPVALFALGATLFGQPVRAAAGEVTAISLLKLIVHPLLVALFFLGYRVKTRFGSRLLFYRAACRLPRMFSCLPIIMVPIRGAQHRPFWSAQFLPAPPCRSFYIGCFMGKANRPNKLPWPQCSRCATYRLVRYGSCLPAFCQTQSYDRVQAQIQLFGCALLFKRKLFDFMIAELGHFALITAFILSLAQGVLPLFGAARGNSATMLIAPAAAISVALACCLFVWRTCLGLYHVGFLTCACCQSFTFDQADDL
jgi:hypothetical protein